MLSETYLRLGIFIGVLFLMMVLEAVLPKRKRTQARTLRWGTNLALVVVNAFVLKLLGPIAAVVAADYAMDNHWGLLSFSPVAIPLYLEIIIAVILLDLAIYIQHVLSHRMSFLWRFHKVHHADRDIDVTTGIRFHPIEVVFSMIYKCGIILMLGPVAVAVVVFEVLLNASAMFNHANIRLPKKIDTLLRFIIVTPDFHRVHHSVIKTETNSNYGFFLSIWDKLFKTYTAQPEKNHHGMSIGLNQYQNGRPSLFLWCLFVPFKKTESGKD